MDTREASQDPRHSKIAQHCISRGRDEDIGTAEVAMDDRVGMHFEMFELMTRERIGRSLTIFQSLRDVTYLPSSV